MRTGPNGGKKIVGVWARFPGERELEEAVARNALAGNTTFTHYCATSYQPTQRKVGIMYQPL